METFFTEQQRGAESLKLKGLNIFSSSRSPGTQERNFRKKKMAPLAADSTLHHFLLYNVSPFILFPLLPLQRKKRKRKKRKNLREKRPTVWSEPVTFPLGPKRFLSFFFLFFSLSPQHKKEKDKYSLRSAPPAELKKMRRSSLCGTETSREQLLN